MKFVLLALFFVTSLPAFSSEVCDVSTTSKKLIVNEYTGQKDNYATVNCTEYYFNFSFFRYSDTEVLQNDPKPSMNYAYVINFNLRPHFIKKLIQSGFVLKSTGKEVQTFIKD